MILKVFLAITLCGISAVLAETSASATHGGASLRKRIYNPVISGVLSMLDVRVVCAECDSEIEEEVENDTTITRTPEFESTSTDSPLVDEAFDITVPHQAVTTMVFAHIGSQHTEHGYDTMILDYKDFNGTQTYEFRVELDGVSFRFGPDDKRVGNYLLSHGAALLPHPDGPTNTSGGTASGVKLSKPGIRVLWNYERSVVLSILFRREGHHEWSSALQYELNLERAPEPCVGQIIDTRSMFQQIRVFKGSNIADVYNSEYTCDESYDYLMYNTGGVFSSRDLFLSSWQCPSTPHHVLYLNNMVQTDTAESAAHSAMVRVPLMYAKNLRRIFIAGGGDAQAAAELLKFATLWDSVVQVELDDVLLDVWKNHPLTRQLSNNALNNPRVRLIAGDALQHLIDVPDGYYDLIIDDCEVDVTGQPKGLRDRYAKYCASLVKKLSPGGVVATMEPLDVEGEFCDSSAFPSRGELSLGREQALLRTARGLHVEARDFVHTPHIMSQVVQCGQVGPHQFVYLSNEPFQKRRNIDTGIGVRRSGRWISTHEVVGPTDPRLSDNRTFVLDGSLRVRDVQPDDDSADVGFIREFFSVVKSGSADGAERARIELSSVQKLHRSDEDGEGNEDEEGEEDEEDEDADEEGEEE